jgi:Acetyltransferase (GNAT) family
MENYKESENNKVLCCCIKNQVIGCISLEFVGKKNEKRVYNLNILIVPKEQGKGYGRILFEAGCSNRIEHGDTIRLNDATDDGIGDKLYGGEITRQKFDVSMSLKGNMYFINKKEGNTKKLNYFKRK